GRIALLLLALAGVVVAARRGAELAVLCTVVPVAAAALVWAIGPRVFVTRNFLGVAPFVAICIAAVLASLPRRLGGSTAVLAVAGPAGSGGRRRAQVRRLWPLAAWATSNAARLRSATGRAARLGHGERAIAGRSRLLLP